MATEKINFLLWNFFILEVKKCFPFIVLFLVPIFLSIHNISSVNINKHINYLIFKHKHINYYYINNKNKHIH